MRSGSTDAPSDLFDHVKRELQRLRQGQGLGHPGAVLGLSPTFRKLICGDQADSLDTATEVIRIVQAVRGAIEGLDPHLREYALVDFNLDERHSFPKLGDRQESLAAMLKFSAKTVQRHAGQALDTVALTLVSGTTALSRSAAPAMGWHTTDGYLPKPDSWQAELCGFWGLTPGGSVDIVCSELPEEQRPSFASPSDRNYLRYGKFVDLDSLIYVRSHLVQALPSVVARDFSPSEYFDAGTSTLVVLGGPPWNAKFREFQAQLPFYFEPHPPGEDDPLVVPLLGNRQFGPRWTRTKELLTDVSVFVRLTLAQGTTVFLSAGCLTLGVLGAAMCFLQAERGARNVGYVDEQVGTRDFVLVAEASRVGGITDIADLAITGPILLMARSDRGRFEVVVDDSAGKDYQPV